MPPRPPWPPRPPPPRQEPGDVQKIPSDQRYLASHSCHTVCVCPKSMTNESIEN